MKWVLRILLLLILLVAAALLGYFFLGTEGEKRDPLTFIPTDFLYAIESDRPVKDWQGVSKSEFWGFLKQHSYIREVSSGADYLDSLLDANPLLVKFVKLGSLTISAHGSKPGESNFLYLIDLRGRKVPKFKPALVEIFKSLDYEVSTENYFNLTIYELYDPEARETLSVSVIDNVLIASYEASLVKKAIDQSERPGITENQDYQEIRKLSDPNALYSVYLNFSRFRQLLRLYSDSPPASLADVHRLLSYGVFDLDAGDDFVAMEGFINPVDSVASYINALRGIGPGRVGVQDVLPQETATLTTIGFSDFSDFFARFLAQYEVSSPDDFAVFQKRSRKIEKAFKINFERDFFSWMTEEVGAAVVRHPRLVDGQAYYALLHFDDYDSANSRLQYLVERVKKPVFSPVKFEQKDYRGYTIRYLELKEFFKLFFKKMFDRIEQPHFTIVDDYVVFSNDTTALQFVIDHYLGNHVLSREEGFTRTFREFSGKSNMFLYLNQSHFYPLMEPELTGFNRSEKAEMERYIRSFPHLGFQLQATGELYEAWLFARFEPVEVLPGMSSLPVRGQVSGGTPGADLPVLTFIEQQGPHSFHHR